MATHALLYPRFQVLWFVAYTNSTTGAIQMSKRAMPTAELSKAAGRNRTHVCAQLATSHQQHKY